MKTEGKEKERIEVGNKGREGGRRGYREREKRKESKTEEYWRKGRKRRKVLWKRIERKRLHEREKRRKI